MEDKTYRWFLVPALILLVLCIYVPVLRGLVMAFQNYNMFDLTNIHFIGLENFSAVIRDVHISFGQILANTLVWVTASLLFQFVLGFILALAMKEPFRGRGIYSGFVFYAWALSGFAIGLTWAWLFNGQFGLINDLLVRIGLLESPIGFLSSKSLAMIAVLIPNIWYGVPFFGIMLLAALQSVPAELYEAATIDGAGRVRQLFSVTIPYVRPTIISTVLLRTMWIINFPDIIYAMTSGGPVNRTNILATQMINKIFKEYDYGQGAAIGVIIMVLLFVYAIFYLRVTGRQEEEF
ncbi:MAG: sugar ABC transporter permease [Spirochaetia bacterium]|nr:sugar ABC transporter permease [Spirochaetia bacterium]MCF7940854.1 sugar ABC transporter permease [Spirochaetia bacterium]